MVADLRKKRRSVSIRDDHNLWNSDVHRVPEVPSFWSSHETIIFLI